MKIEETDGHVIENVVCERETDKAILAVWDGGAEPHWIPKSVILKESEIQEPGDEGALVIKRWFAEKEGLE